MGLQFTKMHGLGNDYVFISLLDQQVPDPAGLSRAISDRHRGVGSDGLILISSPDARDAHVRMIMHNADGSRAEMCGNGIRCLAKLVYERGWARKNPLQVQTDRGVLTLELTLEQERVSKVRVDMGAPILDPQRIPVAVEGDRAVGLPIAIPGAGLKMTCVSMGNPHAVFFTQILDEIPLAQWGPQLEHHDRFPQRTNVHFVQVRGRDRLRMLTWERGAGITQACGTGAAAVCVAGVLNNLCERQVTIMLPGGELELDWDAESDHVFKTGPATEVFTGTWPNR